MSIGEIPFPFLSLPTPIKLFLFSFFKTKEIWKFRAISREVKELSETLLKCPKRQIELLEDLSTSVDHLVQRRISHIFQSLQLDQQKFLTHLSQISLSKKAIFLNCLKVAIDRGLFTKDALLTLSKEEQESLACAFFLVTPQQMWSDHTFLFSFASQKTLLYLHEVFHNF